MVLNRDDVQVMNMLPAIPAVTAARRQRSQCKQRFYITFGSDLPQRPGDFGLEVAGGITWLVRAHTTDEACIAVKKFPTQEIYLQRLMPTDMLRIYGRHNAVNALAALALAHSVGCALSPMLYGLREYRGEPHRVQSIAIVCGVEYFDDSKGTNVGATVAALTGLGTERRLVLILGGAGKGQDFTPLAAPVARYARAVLLIGQDAAHIRMALQDTGVPLWDCPNLPEAVRIAAGCAHAGDAVLLSPACASLDMFDHYRHRAQVFRDAVQGLTENAEHVRQIGVYE